MAGKNDTLSWRGNLLLDNKNYIYAAVVKSGKEYTVIAYRNHSLLDFDGFKTTEEARRFAERATR